MVGGGDLAPRTIQPVLFALSPSLPLSRFANLPPIYHPFPSNLLSSYPPSSPQPSPLSCGWPLANNHYQKMRLVVRFEQGLLAKSYNWPSSRLFRCASNSTIWYGEPITHPLTVLVWKCQSVKSISGLSTVIHCAHLPITHEWMVQFKTVKSLRNCLYMGNLLTTSK